VWGGPPPPPPFFFPGPPPRGSGCLFFVGGGGGGGGVDLPVLLSGDHYFWEAVTFGSLLLHFTVYISVHTSICTQRGTNLRGQGWGLIICLTENFHCSTVIITKIINIKDTVKLVFNTNETEEKENS